MTTQTAGEHIPSLTLGWRMQMALRDSGKAVQDVADELDVSRATVSRWLNDKGTGPRRPFLVAFALSTGVSIDWLASGDMPTQPTPPRPRGTTPKPANASLEKLTATKRARTRHAGDTPR